LFERVGLAILRTEGECGGWCLWLKHMIRS
jgi:hypothetical protein